MLYSHNEIYIKLQIQNKIKLKSCPRSSVSFFTSEPKWITWNTSKFRCVSKLQFIFFSYCHMIFNKFTHCCCVYLITKYELIINKRKISCQSRNVTWYFIICNWVIWSQIQLPFGQETFTSSANRSVLKVLVLRFKNSACACALQNAANCCEICQNSIKNHSCNTKQTFRDRAVRVRIN